MIHAAARHIMIEYATNTYFRFNFVSLTETSKSLKASLRLLPIDIYRLHDLVCGIRLE